MSIAALRCACGQVQGTVDVDPSDVNRVVCYCDDCQAFAVHLGAEERAHDAHGGTEIVQVSVAKLRFEEGAQELRALRLSEKGMVRWYAGCCDTPLVNTMAGAGVPFAGVLACNLDREVVESLEPVFKVNGRFAPGAPDAVKTAPLGLILRNIRRMGRWWWRGDAARTPFRGPDGAWVVEPVVLTPEQRAALPQGVPAS